MAFADSWHIRSRARECAASGQPFSDNEPIVTALFVDAEDGYVRKDFRIEAWDARPADAEKAFSVWKAVYHAPVVEEKPQINKENPEELLRRLVEEDEDHTENVRYILAVMLERQKLLRETDTQRLPTGILRVYEHRKNGDVFLIRDPNIPLSQVDQVQEEIILMLETGGRKPVEDTQESGESEGSDSTDASDASPPAESSPEGSNERDDSAAEETVKPEETAASFDKEDALGEEEE